MLWQCLVAFSIYYVFTILQDDDQFMTDPDDDESELRISEYCQYSSVEHSLLSLSPSPPLSPPSLSLSLSPSLPPSLSSSLSLSLLSLSLSLSLPLSLPPSLPPATSLSSSTPANILGEVPSASDDVFIYKLFSNDRYSHGYIQMKRFAEKPKCKLGNNHLVSE